MNVAAMNQSIAIVKDAMQHLEKRYAEWQAGADLSPVDFQPFFDACTDDVVFYIPMTSEPEDGDHSRQPWNVVGKAWQGKEAMIEAFETDQADLADWVVGAPLEYYSNADGTRVVVLLKERYAKPSGSVPWSEAAMVFDMRGGEISSYKHLADMSGYLVVTGYHAVAEK
jgi:ketosteroid isomerase-like protein